MTSYNYLGLSTHPEVIQAAKDALDLYGLGASGAPLLSGTFDLHVKFARKLAEFKQKEDCLLYSSGLGRERRRHPGAAAQGRHVRPRRKVPQEPDRRRHPLRGKDAVLLP